MCVVCVCVGPTELYLYTWPKGGGGGDALNMEVEESTSRYGPNLKSGKYLYYDIYVYVENRADGENFVWAQPNRLL